MAKNRGERRWFSVLTVSAVFFGLAAAGGLTMAYLKFSGSAIPIPLALGHGAMALIGLILLLWHVFAVGVIGNLLIASSALFVIAALGGVVLFSYHLGGRSLPNALILIHGSVAILAFLLLIAALVS